MSLLRTYTEYSLMKLGNIVSYMHSEHKILCLCLIIINAFFRLPAWCVCSREESEREQQWMCVVLICLVIIKSFQFVCVEHIRGRKSPTAEMLHSQLPTVSFTLNTSSFHVSFVWYFVTPKCAHVNRQRCMKYCQAINLKEERKKTTEKIYCLFFSFVPPHFCSLSRSFFCTHFDFSRYRFLYLTRSLRQCEKR